MSKNFDAFYFKKLRSQGYTLEQSLAELADNSITHNANNIWVYMYWSDDTGKDSFIMVVDDGDGMNENELLNKALTIPKDDIMNQKKEGHSVYGLGLKTGSFNHCRSITIITKKNRLLKKTLNLTDGQTDYMPSCMDHRFIKKHLDLFAKRKKGTIIILSDLDKISEMRASDRGPNFYEDCDKSKKHFKLTYHKYLLKDKIKIFFQGIDEINRTKAIDPFYKNHPSTIKLENIEISFYKGGDTILKPYIIPIDTGDENLGKSKNDLQGLYFLRNNRLIDCGGWFGLGEKNKNGFWSSNDRFNRLRIEIDIPIETSKHWITHTKNSVKIPDYAISKMRKHLVQIRKEFTAKIGQINEDSKDPIDENLKKKRELNKVIKNRILNEEDLTKIQKFIENLK